MVSQSISAVCMFGIVILGMLIMTRAVTLEQAMSIVGRALLLMMGALVAICMVKMLLISVVIPWLSSLKAMLLWFALIAFAVLGVILIGKIVISKFQS